MAASIAAGAGALGAAAGAAASLAAAGASSETWRDRLREAAYTSPSGVRIPFEYTDVSREYDLRTAQFDFPGVDNSYVQQNGYSARRYPLRCVFWGGQCDLVAAAFEAGLLERGTGKLEHPLYGTITVVPFGTITRRDDLKSAANQSIVEVTFWTTTGAVYPSSTRDAQSEILAALDGFDLAAALQYSNSAQLSSAISKANLLATVAGYIKDVGAVLGEISSAVSTVNAAFRDLESLVNLSLDVLIGTPLQLALQVSNLIKAPGKALSAIESRLDGYANLYGRIAGSPGGSPSNQLATSGHALLSRRTTIANDFQAADLFASNAVAGAISAAIADPVAEPGAATSSLRSRLFSGKNFSTKPQAIAAAEAIIVQFETAVAWRDAGYAALGAVEGVSAGQVDTGESYAALRRAAMLAAGTLVQTSFDLRPERRIVLDRPRTIVDVAAELYQSTSNDVLDFLIETNDLTGDDILELPRARAIVYYP